MIFTTFSHLLFYQNENVGILGIKFWQQRRDSIIVCQEIVCIFQYVYK